MQLGQIFHIARGSTGREIYVMEDSQSKSKSVVIIHFSFSVLNFGTARWYLLFTGTFLEMNYFSFSDMSHFYS